MRDILAEDIQWFDRMVEAVQLDVATPLPDWINQHDYASGAYRGQREAQKQLLKLLMQAQAIMGDLKRSATVSGD